MNPYEAKPNGRYTLTCGTGADVDWSFRTAIGEVTADTNVGLDERCDFIVARARALGRNVIRDTNAGGIEGVRCFGYCLGVASHWDEMKRIDASPTDAFIHWLVEREALVFKEAPDMMVDGDVVVYHTSNYRAVHGGYYERGRVRSKWGGLPVFGHGLWDVPSSYGTLIRAYKPPTGDMAWAEFCAWVRSARDIGQPDAADISSPSGRQ